MQLERSTTSTWRSPSLWRAALDRGAGRDRERAPVALVAVGGVVDRQLGLAGADDGVGEAVGARRAEVGVEVVAAVGVDVGDGRGGVGGDGGAGDVLVPGGLVGQRGRTGGERGRRVGEDLAAAEVRVGADGLGRGRPGAAARSARWRGEPARLIPLGGVPSGSCSFSTSSSPIFRRLIAARSIARRPTVSRPIAKPPTAAAPTASAPIAAAPRIWAPVMVAGRASGRKKAIPRRTGTRQP